MSLAMKVSIGLLLALIALGGYVVQTVDWVALQGRANAPEGVTERSIFLEDFRAGDGLKVTLWFPQGSCDEGDAERGLAKFCLSDVVVTDRVVVLSHGAGGAATSYRWLAYSLAEQGYVVVGINHLAESWIYGSESVDPSATVKLWLRAQDVTTMLDRLAVMPLFQRELNWSRVIGVGHSSGGQTMALLAGARYGVDSIRAYCLSNAAKNDKGCAYKWPEDAPIEAWTNAFQADYNDSRIQQMILFDPGIGPALIPASAQAVQQPTLVVASVENDFLPFQQHGLRYHQLLPRSQLMALDDGAGHFVYLDVCEHEFSAMGVPLCSDREGVDRGLVHKQVVQRVLSFLAGEA